MPTVGDDAEQLVTEHELGSAVGRHTEHALGDLPVGAAHADLEYLQQQLAGAGPHRGHLGDPRRVGGSGTGDETLHGQAPSLKQRSGRRRSRAWCR